jgi:tRNA-splicing ligase RtcB (3'-phosphate/5'-hydroxy nucleic acid ligase)
MSEQCPLKKIDDYRWLIPKTGPMRAEGLIYADEKMLDGIIRDKASGQVGNVACLPGIEGRSLAMPDIHWGYGFPIGGVAAFDISNGVISPGGIGFDINCGVRMLRSNLKKEDISAKLPELISGLFANIPSGVGSTGKINLTKDEVRQVLDKGAKWAVKKGYGNSEDLGHTEEEGCLEGADSSCVSSHALERGREQLGTLGAGNHFLEIQEVSEIYDPETAGAFGLFPGQVTIMIHTGSRGLGYQVCDDSIKKLQSAVHKYKENLPDRQLVYAPVDSPEGREYYSAMAAAANYAWANRQIIMHWVRETVERVLGKSPRDTGLELIYDVAHNIGKFEEHGGKKLFVHRKGATRAFPKGHPAVPSDYRNVGQPVLIPGTMGTASYILVGTEQAMKETWGSTCHGAGRVMSRTQALGKTRGDQVVAGLKEKGILVQSKSYKTLAEEAPFAYKDVNMVVDVCHKAGISKKVAKLVPLGVIKG